MSEFPDKSPSTLKALFDSLPDLIVVYDERGRYLDVLAGHQVLSFQSPKRLIGRNVRDLLNEETANEIIEGIDRALSAGGIETIEYEVELAGESFWFDGQISPIEPDEPGADPDRVVFIARDVSQRRRQQAELERQNERLAEFAEVVSHDLRSPLSVLEGSLELAEETGEAEHFERCRRAVSRMDQLIEDLLALAREDGPVDDPDPVELAAVAEKSWGTVDTGTAGLVVEAEGTVLADRVRLRQLLENLFGNAVEHGGPDVTVRIGMLAGAGTADGDGVGKEGFYVEDDGSGIPAEERDRVFDRGFSTADRGTGFGLAIVERVAEAHGWDVAATESEAGGARFEITGLETSA
jgi:PAS domain S-box-containing protein